MIRLGITGKLKRTLRVDEPVRIDDRRPSAATQRNVKNWCSGEMCLRWTAAGMLEAENQFRKVDRLPRARPPRRRDRTRLHLPQPNRHDQEAAITVTM